MPTCQLSDYDVGPILGVGTVGTIFAATDRQSGQPVALKRLHDSVRDNDLIVARFRRERAVMERLNHPNIVRYFGGGEDDGTLFYVMEQVDGGTVKDLLQTHTTLPWPVVVEIGRQICSALQCAHNHGVVHRDLKPGNLFLTQQGDLKLGDFGIARDLEGTDLSADGMTVGTHAYMAPEQITGDDSVSGKADLYSLGCCLFEMLVGRKPFHGDSASELFEQHLHAPPPKVAELIGDCPPELDEIVQRLLAKKADDRPFNARQVQGELIRVGELAATSESSGRQILQLLLQSHASKTPPAEVRWSSLAVMIAMIVAVIVAASVLSHRQ